MLTPTPPMAPQLSMAGLRVIAFVEAQLGEQLRDDGPVLGIEFDPLPPGAFGAPIAMTGQQKQPVRPYDGKIFDRHEAKSFKASAFLPSMEHPFIPSSSSGKRRPAVGGSLVVHPQVGSRAPHEYQFLPQQPSIRSETYERIPQSHFYDSSVVAPSSRVSSLPSGGAFLHGNEQVAPSYTFQGQMPSASLLPQQNRQQMIPSGSAEYDGAPHSNSLTNTAKDSQLGIHQTIGSENPFLSPDKIYHDEDPSRTDRKRKHAPIDESRIAKGDTNEKRIKKELEKQENLRRKNEERMQKAKERHDRERKKEEERMEREKQREKYRVEREQKREIERIEKLRQKNMQREEKTRQKEESKKEKEAARAKAANEKATAKRIAKESSELIEDERLELMELAASSKGLSSIISLDSETLEQLDLFRGMLSTFPPKSVRLVRPFAIQPWKDSEENIGNLLMVWKFLITFADILGLWPFTLDEFVQSLHDFDSRLLGEIHVVLLKSIIKDIEDVARTPAIALGTNQASAVNPGGGHPQIVEGAYAWGFDICSWQRHLNPLTWPEILRQFALSSGFGPQLKKRNIEHTYFRDDNEGDDGEDVISTLRNGAAAENAVALMHEKGYSHRRRSRHRLTPGTVKFAAFHVLSFEGSRGLTILEVAEKIQKSGLRDLTTSKTPEASIAAALSRDTKLFERTAPSTYCLRPAFRKDPADADAILSAAREKVQIFANALSDSEEAEKDVEDADDAERDDDSECDVADDPEVDDLGIQKLTKNSSHLIELKDGRASSSLDNENSGILCNKVCPLPQTGLGNVEKGFPQSLDVGFNCHEASNTDIEGTEIDESNLGEPWVQGLTEGEYSDLSVEERLSALVSLIGVAIEGNSIRVILEERLEAATALKKQIWAEGQLDKRRWKEDLAGKVPYSSFVGYKAETTQTNAAAGESPTPLQLADNKDNDGNLTPLDNDQVPCPQSLGSIKNSTSIERNLSGQEFSVNPDTVPLQHGIAVEKSRSQLKSYIGHKAEELYVYRSLPLGQDRRRNRYWLFSTSASRNDPGSGRIFFESREGFWRLIDSEEAFDALLAALDTRGVRESHLHSMLQRIETTFKETCRKRKFTNSVNPSESLNKAGATEMTSSPDCSTEFDSPSSTLCGLTLDTSQYSHSFNIELGRNELERNSALKRYNVLLKWMWKGCYNPFILCAMKYGKKRCPELLQTCNLCYQSYFAEEMHCPSCHKTFKSFYNAETIFLEHVAQCKERRKIDPDWKIQLSDAPIAIQFLKAQFSLIEASIPADALQPFWTDGYRKSWGVKLQSSSSAEDHLQILTLLEDAVKRDCFSSNFETTNQLLSSTTRSGVGNSASSSGSVPVLPWVPDTTAAVSLRLLDLDASISYMKVESHKERESGEFIKLPSRYAVVKNFQEVEPTETPDETNFLERKWVDPVSSGRRGRGRGSRGGRGGRGRGRGGRVGRPRGQGRASEFGEGSSSINYEKTTRKYTRRGRERGRGGRKRGRRSVRPHQMLDSSRVVVDKAAFQFGGYNFGTSTTTAKPDSSSRSSGDEWQLEENRLQFIGEEEDDNSVGFQSDENGQASADEYDELPQEPDYRRVYHDSQPMNDDTDEDDEDDDDDDDEVEGNGHDIDMDDDEYGDEDGVIDGGIGGNGDEDEGASFYSSEFSD